MQLEQFQTLLEAFEKSSSVSLVWETEQDKIQLKKAAAYPVPVTAVTTASPVASGTAPAPVEAVAPVAPTETPAVSAPAPEQEQGETITAPLVGTFYAAPAPGKPAFAPVGATIKQGETLCLLEAMKMMSEVPAPFDCVIQKVLIEDGELAAFGTALFQVTRL